MFTDTNFKSNTILALLPELSILGKTRMKAYQKQQFCIKPYMASLWVFWVDGVQIGIEVTQIKWSWSN